MRMREVTYIGFLTIILTCLATTEATATDYLNPPLEFENGQFPSLLPYEAYKEIHEGRYEGGFYFTEDEFGGSIFPEPGDLPAQVQLTFNDRQLNILVTGLDEGPYTVTSERGETCVYEFGPAIGVSPTTTDNFWSRGGRTVKETSVGFEFPFLHPENCRWLESDGTLEFHFTRSTYWDEHFASAIQPLGLRYGPIVGCSGNVCQHAYIHSYRMQYRATKSR